MAAIDQYRELDRARASAVHQRVQRGAGRAPREEHVVDKDDGKPRDTERNVRTVQNGVFGQHGEVVSVKSDVQNPDRHLDPFDFLDEPSQLPGQRNPSALDTYQRYIRHTLVFLDDLMGNTRYRPFHGASVHDFSLFPHIQSLPAQCLNKKIKNAPPSFMQSRQGIVHLSM